MEVVVVVIMEEAVGVTKEADSQHILHSNSTLSPNNRRILNPLKWHSHIHHSNPVQARALLRSNLDQGKVAIRSKATIRNQDPDKV